MPIIDVNEKRGDPNARIELETFWSEVADWNDPRNIIFPPRNSYGRPVNVQNDIFIPLGRMHDGRYFTYDLSTGQSLLLAGSMLSGVGMFRRTALLSMIRKHSPETLRFVLLDPIRSLSDFDEIPHLLFPRAVSKEDCLQQLKAIKREEEKRFEVLEAAKVDKIYHYNQREPNKSNRFPTIVVMISELGELNSREFISTILDILAVSRMVDIWFIVATQRPDENNIDSRMRSCMFMRIAFQVPSKKESMLLIDQPGAEKLLGQGDMIFYNGGEGEIPRSIASDRQGNIVRMQGFHHPVDGTASAVKEMLKHNISPSNEG